MSTNTCNNPPFDNCNFVPNYSFEDISSDPSLGCPANLSEINKTCGWNFIIPNTGTTDYYNSCSLAWPLGIVSAEPTSRNLKGDRLPRTGNGYAGIISGFYDNYREYLQEELFQPLTAGTLYYVEYFVSNAEGDYYALDRLGAYFTNIAVNNTALPSRINVIPQVESPAGLIHSNQTGWDRISGCFNATGGEQYIVLGCFAPMAGLSWIISGASGGYAYYFIEDVFVSPLIVDAGADATITCTGSTTLTANSTCLQDQIAAGAFTFTWSPATGLSSTSGQSVTANPTTTTTYTVTMTASDGHSVSDEVTVTVDPPCFNVTASSEAEKYCLGSDVNLFANYVGGTSPYAFSWSSIPAGFTSTLQNPVANPTTTGTITYTVTITDANFQTSSSSISIFVVNANSANGECCIPDAFNPLIDLDWSNTTSSSHGSIIAIPNIILIDGLFTVNNDFTFTGCTHVILGPNAIIEVLNGNTLHIYDSHLFACAEMWQGIIVDNGGNLDVNASIIEDAQYAARLDGTSGSLKVLQSTFQNNYVGIYLPPLGIFHQQNIIIDQSKFYTTRTLVAPYASQNPVPGSVGFAGILIYDTPNFSIGGGSSATYPNIFDGYGDRTTLLGLSNGIISHVSNVTLVNTRFLNIIPDNAYTSLAPTGNGSAIFSNSIPQLGFYYLKQQGFGNNASVSLSSFENCKYGVYTQYVRTYISLNVMKQMHEIGINVFGNITPFKEVSIHDNYIDADHYGIRAFNNDGSHLFSIVWNEIHFGCTSLQTCPLGIGIVVGEYGTNVPTFKDISFNRIYFNSGGSGLVGMRILNGSKCNIWYNYVELDNNTSNYFGIDVIRGNIIDFRCNTVVAPAGNSYSNMYQSGVRFVKSTYSTIGCNHVSNSTNGFYFSIDNPNTDFKGNEMNTDDKGVRFDNLAVIDPQPNKGNLWNGTFSHHLFHSGIPPVALQSQFKFDNDLYCSANTKPVLFAPWSLALPYFGGTCSYFECSPLNVDPSQYYCNYGSHQFAATAGSLDKMIATDSLHFNEYQDEMKWSLDKYLYEKLANNPAMRDTDTAMSSFYFNHQNSIFEGFNNVYDSLGATFAADSALRASIAGHGQTIEISSHQVAINDSILGTDTTLSSGQRMALKSANEMLLQTISSNTEYINTALQQLKDNRLLDLQAVMQLNLGITTTRVMETNQRIINNIFMATLAIGIFDFTAQQISDIYDIAVQCPVSGGSSVYQARFMYELIYPEMEYDDELSCLQGGIVLRKAKGEITNATYIYPNPASTSATLRFNSDTNGSLDVFDMVGNKVLSFNLAGKLHEFAFDIGAFANGIYHYRVSFPNQDVINGKFSVVR